MAWWRKGAEKRISSVTDEKPISSSGVNHSVQARAFLYGEGNQWYLRNKDKPLRQDLLAALRAIPVGATVLEVGCSDGRYLFELQEQMGCSCSGIDPSLDAIETGRHRYPKLNLKCADAKTGLHRKVEDGERFDVIIFGFCLYLIDRSDLFSIVAYADQLLRDDGYLVIHDFEPQVPSYTNYHHKNGIFSYKMDYPGLWLANPCYRRLIKRQVGDGAAVTVLRKYKWENQCAFWPYHLTPT